MNTLIQIGNYAGVGDYVRNPYGMIYAWDRYVEVYCTGMPQKRLESQEDIQKACTQCVDRYRDCRKSIDHWRKELIRSRALLLYLKKELPKRTGKKTSKQLLEEAVEKQERLIGCMSTAKNKVLSGRTKGHALRKACDTYAEHAKYVDHLRYGTDAGDLICDTHRLWLCKVLPEINTWENIYTGKTQNSDTKYGSDILHIRTRADVLEAIETVELTVKRVYRYHYEKDRERLKTQIAMIRELRRHMKVAE